MNIPITFTFGQLIAAFLWTCGAITAVCVAASWIYKTIKAARKPTEDKEHAIEEKFGVVHKRIDKLEEAMKESCGRYENLVEHYHQTALVHDEAINALMSSTKLLLRTQQASIDFKLSDEKDKSALENMKTEISTYLRDKAFPETDSGWRDMDVG